MKITKSREICVIKPSEMQKFPFMIKERLVWEIQKDFFRRFVTYGQRKEILKPAKFEATRFNECFSSVGENLAKKN